MDNVNVSAIRLKDLLTVEQTAAALGGSRFIVEQLVKRGQLPKVRLGPRCVRYPRAAVEELVRSRESPT